MFESNGLVDSDVASLMSTASRRPSPSRAAWDRSPGRASQREAGREERKEIRAFVEGGATQLPRHQQPPRAGRLVCEALWSGGACARRRVRSRLDEPS